MTTYQNDREKDLFFCNLSKRYEISKIVREDKLTKRCETIYQSVEAELRERTGIEKMLVVEGMKVENKLVAQIIKVNLKFGKYHLMQELRDTSAMLEKCKDKREKALVECMSSMLAEAQGRKDVTMVGGGLTNGNNRKNDCCVPRRL